MYQTSFTNVTVTDVSGVNGTAGTRPRVYYKRSSDANTYVDNTSGTNDGNMLKLQALLHHSLSRSTMLLSGGGGVAVNNTVQYFIVAQDLAATPNVGINPVHLMLILQSVALTAGAFPLLGVIQFLYNIRALLLQEINYRSCIIQQHYRKNITFRKEVTTVRKEVNVR
ncbi:MAG: hypothetical protein R3A12_07060 [Ignavibacteria bacterium]